jgi:periplasmic divalent cation tolerance protein
MWNNQLETAQESKIFLKTRIEHFEKVKEIILQNSKFEVPEISYTSLEGGNQAYLDWIKTSTPTLEHHQ